MSMKNSNDTIGNRTRDLPTCSVVPQPPAPPPALNTFNELFNRLCCYEGKAWIWHTEVVMWRWALPYIQQRAKRRFSRMLEYNVEIPVCSPESEFLYKETDMSVMQIYVLLTVHLSIRLDNDQLDAQLLYFTIHPLQSSTCFEHYMLIIRRLNALMQHLVSSLSVSGRSVRRLRQNCSAQSSLNLCTGRPVTERTLPDVASIKLSLLMMRI